MLGRRPQAGLMRLDDALAALGNDGAMGNRIADVPISQVVGTVGRPYDFDEDFRLINTRLRTRRERLRAMMSAGAEPPPIRLVQLGDLYFVSDGHHRVSVARELGRRVITAHVHRICTVAYGLACLRAAHLASKRAELEFLRQVPLPEDVRADLWLDTPAEWMRLTDAARSWALERTFAGRAPADRDELAATWWAEEVVPVLDRVRAAGHGLDLRDVQVYATALAIRDRLGSPEWPPDLADKWLSPGRPRRRLLLPAG